MEGIGKVTVKTDAQKADELNRLKEWVKKLIPDSYDKFDVQAEYDSGISYTENKNIIRAKLKLLVNNFRL